jgi:hypothetical protein
VVLGAALCDVGGVSDRITGVTLESWHIGLALGLIFRVRIFEVSRLSMHDPRVG